MDRLGHVFLAQQPAQKPARSWEMVVAQCGLAISWAYVEYSTIVRNEADAWWAELLPTCLALAHGIEFARPVHCVEHRDGAIESHSAAILACKVGMLEPVRNGHPARPG